MQGCLSEILDGNQTKEKEETMYNQITSMISLNLENLKVWQMPYPLEASKTRLIKTTSCNTNSNKLEKENSLWNQINLSYHLKISWKMVSEISKFFVSAYFSTILYPKIRSATKCSPSVK